MSYINEALKKAQREKDNHYGRFGYVAPFSTAEPKKSWRWPIAVFTALLIVLAAAVLLIDFFYRPASGVERPAPAEKKTAGLPPAAQKTGLAKKATATASQAASPKDAPPKSSSLEEGKIERLYQEAVLMQGRGDLEAAKKKYLDVLKLDAGHVRALNNLGVVYLATKKSDMALEMFRKAVVLKKDYADPYYNMACLYAQKNDIDQSIWHLKLAASIDEDVKNWVQKDTDFKNVIKSPKFKEFGKSHFSPSPTEGI